MRLSIVLPALNEAAAIVPALERLGRQAPDVERIVADGGSEDDTKALSAPYSRVVSAERGRAKQLNAGAAAASGDWLLFLHVDTRLPDGFAREVAAAASEGYQAGAFSLRIEGLHPFLPVLACGATLRTRWRGIALGDQGLFASRSLFERLGGFPDLPLMEDYAWSLRLKHEGLRLYLSPLRVVTSGRRWDQAGFWHTWWLMRSYYRYFDRNGGPPSTNAYSNIR